LQSLLRTGLVASASPSATYFTRKPILVRFRSLAWIMGMEAFGTSFTLGGVITFPSDGEGCPVPSALFPDDTVSEIVFPIFASS
jgi:hypothetical protein